MLVSYPPSITSFVYTQCHRLLAVRTKQTSLAFLYMVFFEVRLCQKLQERVRPPASSASHHPIKVDSDHLSLVN